MTEAPENNSPPSPADADPQQEDEKAKVDATAETPAKAGASGKAGSSTKAGASGKAKASPKGKGASKKPPAEEEGIFSGRLVTAATIAVAMVIIPVSPLSALMNKKSPTTAARSNWKIGNTEELHLTVVTSDYKKLGCADERITEGGDHCEYKTDRELYPKQDGEAADDTKLHVLQPYRTTDGQLLYTAGFWAQPEISTRLHSEPPQGVAETKLARFIVSCQVKFVTEWQNPRLRWAATDKFASPTNSDGKAENAAMIGELSSCRILEDQRY